MVVVNKIVVAVIVIILVGMAYVLIPREAPSTDEIIFDGPIFVPAPGSEDFSLNFGEFTAKETGIYEHLGVLTYGTLYTSKTGEWIVVDPQGQIPMGGGPGSIIPQVMT